MMKKNNEILTRLEMGQAESKTTFRNPLQYFDGNKPTNPDPFILEYRGNYYCYSTEYDGVQVSVSEDLVHWEHLGYAFQLAGRCSFWAPAVVYRNGVFFLYVSHRPYGSQDAHQQRMCVATSNDPCGPFIVEANIGSHFLIDADVVTGPDGVSYMFYASNEFSDLDVERPGTTVVYDRLVSMTQLEGNPKPALMPTLDDEIFAYNRFGDGRHWHTLEGSAYFERRGWAYMTYSGNAYVRENYFIGYAMAVKRPSLGEISWHKVPNEFTSNPLVCKSDAVEGTGHNSVIKGPNLVDWWMVYHGRAADDVLDESLEQRVMRADRIYFEGDQLRPIIPSLGPIDAPRVPTLSDSFDGGPSSIWVQAEGNAALIGKQWSLLSSRRSTIALVNPVGPYIARIYLKATVADRAARYGISPWWISDSNNLTLWFDAGTRTIEAHLTSGKLVTKMGSVRLSDFDFAVWQQLEIQRNLGAVTLKRGNEVLFSMPWPKGAQVASVAVLSQYTQVELSAFALTEHWDWYAGDAENTRGLGAVISSEQEITVVAQGICNTTSQTKELIFVDGVQTSEELSIDIGFFNAIGQGLLEFSDVYGRRVQVRVTADDFSLSMANEEVHRGRRNPVARLSTQPETATVILRNYNDKSIVEVSGERFVLTALAPKTRPRVRLIWASISGMSRTKI